MEPTAPISKGTTEMFGWVRMNNRETKLVFEHKDALGQHQALMMIIKLALIIHNMVIRANWADGIDSVSALLWLRTGTHGHSPLLQGSRPGQDFQVDFLW